MVVLLAIPALLFSFVAHGAEPEGLLNAFPRSQLAIETSASETHLFTIYLAQTTEQRGRGLMFVRSLEETEGMLFTYNKPASVSMWMKNTYIPLDMIFIGDDWRIVTIHEQTTPHSTRIIESGQKVIAVLELQGGSTSRLGIALGDQIIYPVTNKPKTTN